MSAAPPPDQIAAMFSAIGQFTVAFSGLIHSLENCTVRMVTDMKYGKCYIITETGISGNGPVDGRMCPTVEEMYLVHAAMGERQAAPILASFIATLAVKFGRLPEPDAEIIAKIRKEITALIEYRNRLMHDVWMYASRESLPPELVQTRIRVSADGVEDTTANADAPDIIGRAEDARRLSSHINGIVYFAGPNPPALTTRPAGRYFIKDGKVQRD